MSDHEQAITKGMPVYGAEGLRIGEVMRVVLPAHHAEEERDTDPNIDAPGEQPLSDRRIPFGTFAADKGRGGDSLPGLAARRGDLHTGSAEDAATPGAGGMNALRGYGMPRTDTDDIGTRESTTTAPGTMDAGHGSGLMHAGGAAEPGTGGGTGRDYGRGDDAGQAAGGAPAGGMTGADRLGTPAGAHGAAAAGGAGAMGGDAPAGGAASRPQGYFYVQDHGVLGIGATGLRVPLAAVATVGNGRVTLRYGKEDAERRFGPGRSLQIDESAEFTPY